MGLTGAGKSSVSAPSAMWSHAANSMKKFIETAINSRAEVRVGHDLQSCTHDITLYRLRDITGSGRNIVFIDTPGFDDTNLPDTTILKNIARRLKSMYARFLPSHESTLISSQK
jgi:predicted GTPase